MDGLILMSLATAAGCICGVAFLVCKIIEEEREKREKAAFVKVFSERHNKRRMGCPTCGCLPCQCGS